VGHHVDSLRRGSLDAIGGEADIPWTRRTRCSDVIDPCATSASIFHVAVAEGSLTPYQNGRLSRYDAAF
jgi:hypothetical protein